MIGLTRLKFLSRGSPKMTFRKLPNIRMPIAWFQIFLGHPATGRRIANLPIMPVMLCGRQSLCPDRGWRRARTLSGGRFVSFWRFLKVSISTLRTTRPGGSRGLPARFAPLTPAALRTALGPAPALSLRTRFIDVQRAPIQVCAIQRSNCLIQVFHFA